MYVVGFSRMISWPPMLIARRFAGIFAVIAKLAAVAAREHVHEPEARIVAGHLMLGPGIAEADDDAKR